MDIDSSLRYHGMVDELSQIKSHVFKRMNRNITDAKSRIIDDDVHSMIDEMELLFKQINAMNRLNNHTAKWMSQELSGIRAIEMEPHNIREILSHKEFKLNSMVNFFRNFK